MIEKVKYLVKEILKHNNDVAAIKIMDNSEFKYSTRMIDRWSDPEYEIYLYTDPEIYVKYRDNLRRISDVIQFYINDSSDLNATLVQIKPNYEKISIINSEISIIQTPWDEINILQSELIQHLKRSCTSIDFQNIGNSSRTIMDKLARVVFDEKTHKTSNESDVRNGKFKNQLHSFISSTIAGNQNKELRQFSTSAIDFTEKAINLMNQTTHKLDVQKHFAEVCVISTISVISLIKNINQL